VVRMRGGDAGAAMSNGGKDVERGHDLPTNKGGGALFVLESKGRWYHAGFHLSTSIVAPALLSLPYAMKGLGWAPGMLALIIGAAVSFYAYTLVSKVLEQAELEGHRLLRFRDLGRYALGKKTRSQKRFKTFGKISKIPKISSRAQFFSFLTCDDLSRLMCVGRRWGYYPVAVLQIGLCLGTVIGCVVLGGQSLKVRDLGCSFQ
jgi:hypothetical protein